MNEMTKQELITKITEKKAYTGLPIKDVELALQVNDKPKYTDSEKVKRTKNLLRRMYSSFTSQRLLRRKELDAKTIMKYHRSTRERSPYYAEVYRRIFKGINAKLVIDLGAGINGFSYFLLQTPASHPKYVAIEGMKQLVELMNKYFKENKIKAGAHHLSLFELDKVLDIIKKQPVPRVVLMFKVVDSLELLQRNYSLKLISELMKHCNRACISFATKSFEKRKRFHVSRGWLLNFIKENFKTIDDFELGGERYVVFENK